MAPEISRSLELLDRHVASGQSLVVGYSGGLDSSVLLHAIAQAGRWSVRACHIHHGLSSNADAWATHCQAQAAAWGIECTVQPVTVPRDTGLGLEAAARAARHAALAQCDGDWLVLAHHRGDQAETVLHNLLRGTGVLGLAGMGERNGRILRPLLGVERPNLEAYARLHQLRWIEDESNDDEHYTRNWLRRRVVPLLRDRVPHIEAQIAQAASHAGEAQLLLTQLAAIDAGGEVPAFPVAIATLKGLAPERASNLLRCALTAAGLQAPAAVRLAEFLRQCREAAPDRHPELATTQWRMHVKARQVWLERFPPSPSQ
jgi:tRNA(Ile)-lysidine synthase